MNLRNFSHRDDAWVLLHFHWVRKEMKVERDLIRLLVTRTRKRESWLVCKILGLLGWECEASWRGRWTYFYGWGHKIRVSVTDSGRGSNERIMWIRAFAHELCHAIGGTERECKDMEQLMENRWRKRNGI